MKRQVLVISVVALTAVAANAANIEVLVVVADPVDGIAYMPGEVIEVQVRVKAETTNIPNTELIQADLNVSGTGGDIEDADLDGYDDVNFVYGPQALPGIPGATTITASVPSASGGGTLYVWARLDLTPTALLNLSGANGGPADADGRGFLQFNFVADDDGGHVVVDALGPCLDDTSSSGAHAHTVIPPSQPSQQYANCDVATDPNNEFNFVGGHAEFDVVPEATGLALLALGAVAAIRRRTMISAARRNGGRPGLAQGYLDGGWVADSGDGRSMTNGNANSKPTEPTGQNSPATPAARTVSTANPSSGATIIVATRCA